MICTVEVFGIFSEAEIDVFFWDSLAFLMIQSVQFSSVAQSCPTLWDSMNCSTPGLPVHHQLPEFTQTHVHLVGNAIQPSHPLSSPSPTDVDNMISGSSAFSKTNLIIWKFTVHILLKSGLETFKHYFASVWDECNCAVVWSFFSIAFLWVWNENWPFQSCGLCWVFQICWHIECNTFTASSFRIWKSSTGIPSPPLALFIAMHPRAHLASHSRMSGSRWVTTPLWSSDKGVLNYNSLHFTLSLTLYNIFKELVYSERVLSSLSLFQTLDIKNWPTC